MNDDATLLARLPAAQLAALLIETVGDPRDLARLEVACPGALRTLCPPDRGADRPTPGLPWLAARRLLERRERAWLRAHGIRVRLHRRVERRNLPFTMLTKWTRNGTLHRDDDLPAIAWSDGTRKWYQNGLRHRGRGRPAEISLSPGGKEVLYWWWRGWGVTRVMAEKLDAVAAKEYDVWEC
jgi:hypothetical protein